MPINLQNPENISTGWPGPPQLSAPNIGELVKSILGNRLARDKMTQESVGDTIKQLQQQRASSAYLKMAQDAGLLPAGADLSGFGPYGAEAGGSLAKLIAAKQDEASKEAYMRPYYESMTKQHGAMADYIAQGKPPGVAAGVDVSEHPLGDIWTDPDTGIRMLQTVRGPKPVASPIQPTTARSPSETDTYKLENQLLQQKNLYDIMRQNQERADIQAKRPNVPFAQEQDYQKVLRDLENIRRMRNRPQSDVTNQINTGQATPTPSPTPPATGGPYHAPSAPPVGTVDGGYRFKGGDPQNPDNWELVQ